MGRSKGSSRQPGIPDSTEPVFGRYDKPLNGQNDSSYQPFDNIVNVRDVGAAVNRHCGLRYGCSLFFWTWPHHYPYRLSASEETMKVEQMLILLV
jgi:hypothetical protein